MGTEWIEGGPSGDEDHRGNDLSGYAYVGFVRQNIGGDYGTLRAEFQMSVLDVFGAGAYFRVAGGNLFDKQGNLKHLGSPTPIHKDQLAAATASGGFAALNERLGKIGKTATLQVSTREDRPSPYLYLDINPK